MLLVNSDQGDDKMTTIKIVGAVAAGASAACWIVAALLGTPVLQTFWDGPPPDVAKRLTRQWRWNAAAAWFAAVAALTQAWFTAGQ
jgi:hypothetical protein